MGDSGSKPRATSDKGDRPLKEPRNNVAPNHIVKILVRSSRSAQPLHDGHEKREKYVWLEKAPPPKPFRKLLYQGWIQQLLRGKQAPPVIYNKIPSSSSTGSSKAVQVDDLSDFSPETKEAKTSAYITKFVVCSPNLQLSSVHPIKDEPSALKLPKSTPADGRDARMNCLRRKKFDKDTIKLIKTANAARTKTYNPPLLTDLEILMSHLEALVLLLKGEPPETFEEKTLATHEGEAHSSLAGLDQRLDQWLFDLDVIKSGHVTIVAGLQVAKQLGASWKIEAKEHEQKVKEPREEEQKCAKYQFVQDRKNV
uniref:Uncharacterized protein n=1 Tax=Oryza nivara TaxID=4536 RepID=A0A0E0GWE2_ORYNI